MLELMPISLAAANGFVAEHHRHHKPVRGHKCSLGCMADGRLVGVAIVGRPVSRYLDDGLTLEVNRLCTDGTKNACSFLYGAAARAAKVMGYQKIITYSNDKNKMPFGRAVSPSKKSGHFLCKEEMSFFCTQNQRPTGVTRCLKKQRRKNRVKSPRHPKSRNRSRK